LLLAIDFGRIFKYRKLTFQIGFYPKRKTYFRKLGRILLGKPFFKHTSLNLIIDLFLYNNKRYKLKKIKNLTLRRGIYKYMYSMYIDYSKKIKDTLNRPRFFYMNLIEPKLYKIYNNIIQSYNTYIWGNKKSVFIYFCLLALNFNLFIKIKYNSIISNSKIITNKIENIYDKFNYDINNININVNFDNEIRANTNIFVNKNIDNYLNNKKILNSISKQKLIKSSKSKMLKIKNLSYNIINKKI